MGNNTTDGPLNRILTKTETSYQIVVTGEMVSDDEPTVVQERLSRLFHVPVVALQALLSGKRVVIKKGVDGPTAYQYAMAVREAGLACSVEDMGFEVDNKASQMSLAPLGSLLVEAPSLPSPDIDVSMLSLAPLGAALADPVIPAAPSIDIGALSVAPAGQDLIESPSPPPMRFAMDGSRLTLAPAGCDLEERKADTRVPPLPDTRYLRLE